MRRPDHRALGIAQTGIGLVGHRGRRQHRRRLGDIAPRPRRPDVEDVGHRLRERRVEVDVLRAEDVLDGAEQVDLAVVGLHDLSALLHVGAGEEDRPAMRVHVVRAILHVVFDRDDQRVVGERAVRHRLDHQAEREVALSLLRFRRVEAAERGAEAAHVVVADAHEREVGQGPLGDELIELALPLVVAPQVGVVLVVAAEVDVGERRQRRIERRHLDDPGLERIRHGRRPSCRCCRCCSRGSRSCGRSCRRSAPH